MRGIALNDVTISHAGEDLTFTLKSNGESLTLETQCNRFGGQANAAEDLIFDGAAVLYTDLNPEDVDLIGTAGEDILTGTHFAETIDGRGATIR